MGYKFTQPLTAEQLKARQDKLQAKEESDERDEIIFAMAAAIAELNAKLDDKT